MGLLMVLDTNDELVEAALSCMEDAFRKMVRIVQGSKEKLGADEFLTTYTKIYNACTQDPKGERGWNFGASCYQKYRTLLEDYIKNEVLQSLKGKQDMYLLTEIVSRWSDHLLIIKWFNRFCHYLDRFYISRNMLPTIEDTGIDCFRSLVFKAFHPKICASFLTLMNQEREGKEIDRSVLKRTTEFVVDVNMGKMEFYETVMEKAILKATEAYYKAKASKHILEDTCPKYMIMAEQYLEQEKNRVCSYLHSATLPKLIKIVQKELLSSEDELLRKEHSGLIIMLQEHKIEDLKRMYQLFHQCDGGLDPIASIFKQHVLCAGLSIIKQLQDTSCKQQEEHKNLTSSYEPVFIEKVIELHDEHLSNISTCFDNNNVLYQGLGEGFEVFCNKYIHGISTPEMLANYADNILRKRSGSDGSSDEAIEERLNKIVQLLRYIHDKDLFAEFHRKKLARRLLFDRNANDDHEKYLLLKLKQHNGASFTSKMEGMIMDLALTKEKQGGFEQYLKNNINNYHGIDLYVNILTTGFWPTYQVSNVQLPTELAVCVVNFKGYYEESNESRKLTWITSLGSCTMIGRFDAKPIELIVTTHQAATLMLFNDSERLSFVAIRELLNLTDDEVTRLLHSLSCTKYKILCKEPESRYVSKKDTFKFNAKFMDKMRRIKIPHPPMEEKKKVTEHVITDRKYQIDASIVRIMKSRKTMGFQEIIGECIKQLSHSFKPDVKVIKKRIEDLVQRDFLERDTSDVNMFRYLA